MQLGEYLMLKSLLICPVYWKDSTFSVRGFAIDFDELYSRSRPIEGMVCTEANNN